MAITVSLEAAARYTGLAPRSARPRWSYRCSVVKCSLSPEHRRTSSTLRVPPSAHRARLATKLYCTKDGSARDDNIRQTAADARRALEDDMFKQKRSVRRADSTDAIATFLTRRFGVAGGLAWLGILTFGVVSEQLKTRQEVREAEQGTVEVKGAQEVTLPSGLKYTELKRGGGEAPRPGYIIAADIVAKVDERVVLNTRKAGRQLIFIFGRRQGPITKGVEEGISAMRSGGKRILVIPPDLAFGEEGATLSDGIVPPGATLVYEIELKRVSIPPS